MAATTEIAERLAAVRAAIGRAAADAGRTPGSVALLAISKGQPASAIRAAHAAGQRAFGENYPQELVAKARELADLDLEWHFVGRLQANKTRAVAELCRWVHGLDRSRTAARLGAQRPAALPPLQVCLQIDVDGEPQKGGVAPADALDLARAVAGTPRLALRGLMCLPAAARDDRRAPFRALRRLAVELGAALADHGVVLDALSMGMSDDFSEAIAEGATWVRIGTALFGERR